MTRNVRNWQTYVTAGIALFLLFVPLLFWGNLYVVGGDDSRLYYIFPQQFLTNFSFNVMSSNTLGANLGYMAVSYSAPLIGCLYLLKIIFPFINTQMVAYGIMISAGFIFFYLLMRTLVAQKTTYAYWAGVTASLVYIGSNYIASTLLAHQLVSVYLIMVLPLCLYLFVTGVQRHRMAFVACSALCYSIFSSTLFSLPWLLPVIFTLLPLLAYLAIRYRGSFFKALLIFLCAVVILNVYWIIHYVIPIVYKTGEVSFASSLLTETLKKQNDDLISALVFLNSSVNQMIGYLRTSWSESRGATLGQSLGATYLLCILLAGAVVGKVRKDLRILYLVAVTGLLFTMLFITPNFGQWNLRLFQILNDHIPFFSMFRNMYDKFALAMAFQGAFALFVALVVIGEGVHRRLYKYTVMILIIAVALTIARSNLQPDYHENGYSTRISGQVNEDYVELTRYITNLHTSARFVWFPMTFPGYVYIEDGLNKGHFYTGISPLQIFSRVSDIGGFYGIQTAGDPQLNWNMLDLLKHDSYPDVGRILGEQNIGYVIVNREPIPTQVYDFLNNYDVVRYQTDAYKKEILGEKIRDFGTRYSLYTMNQTYALPTVYVTGDISVKPRDNASVTYEKLRSGLYTVTLHSVSSPTNLVLLEPFNRLWSLQLVGNGPEVNYEVTPRPIYNFGNAWLIDPKAIAAKYPDKITTTDNGYTITFQIEFWPDRLTIPALVLSIISAVGMAMYAVIDLWKK